MPSADASHDEVASGSPLELLENIKREFESEKTREKAINILNQLTNADYDYYDIDHSEYWPDVCDIIRTLLRAIPLDFMLQHHQIVLLMLVNKAPDIVLRTIVDDYLTPALAIYSLEAALRSSEAVIIAIARRVNTKLSNTVVSKFIAHFVDMERVQLDLSSQLNSPEITSEGRFNLYQVAVSAMSLDGFNNYRDIRFLIDSLINELSGDDLLASLTALNLLVDMVLSSHENAVFLTSIGVIQKTYDIMKNASENVDGGMLFTASLRFFGYLSHADPTSIDCYPFFVSTVFNMTHTFDRLDATTRVLAFETFAVMMCSNEAKLKFNMPHEFPKVRKTMNHFGVVIMHSPDEMRVKLFQSLSRLMGSSTTPHDWNVLKTWFGELGEPFPTLMLQYLKRSIERTRIEVLDLIQTMLEKDREWTTQLIVNVNGFMDHLLSREHDPSSDYWFGKYSIICGMMHEKPVACLGEELETRCKHYIEKGVYHSSEERTPEAEWGAL